MVGCRVMGCGGLRVPRWAAFLTACTSLSAELDPAVRQLFNVQSGGAFELEAPSAGQRTAFFCSVSQALALPPPPEADARRERPAPLPLLPRAPEAVAAEEEARKQAEEQAARQR